MSISLQDAQQKALRWRRNGYSFVEVRKELELEDLSSESIHQIISHLNDVELHQIDMQRQKKRALLWMIVGGLITIVGLVLFAASYIYELFTSPYNLHAIVPVVVGYLVFKIGQRQLSRVRGQESEL